MIARLLHFALKQRFLIILASAGVILLGVWSFLQLKIEAYPDISDTGVVVITVYPGHAAEEVEQQVTIPIERALNNVPRVIARRSRTIFGLGVVELTFEDGTDDYFARQLVLEKLRDAELPEGVEPSLGPLSTGISEFYRYRLDGPGYDALELREIQDWVVVPRLLQVAGVADVVPFGGLVKQYQIEVDPYKLEKYKLSVAQVAEAVNANNRNAGGSLLDNRQQALVVRGVGLIRSVDDLGAIIVKSSGGVPIFVRDLGRVTIGGAPQTGIFGVNQVSGGVEGIVLMRRWENPSEVLSRIKETVAELNRLSLPSGVQIVAIHDRTELVNNTLRTVGRTLTEALIIVVAMLLFTFGSLRAAVLTALTIPLSLLFAFACMYFQGIPANLLSIGALDFGIIVDGTLVMVEHIIRRLDERRVLTGSAQDSVFETIRHAALEVERPIFFSLLIIVSAYIPLFTLERVERRLFTPMAYTVCFALVGSLLLTMTLVPALATYFFRGGARHWDNPLLVWVFNGYARLIGWTIRRAKLVVTVGIAAVAGTAFLSTFVGTEFLPHLDEGVIWIRANLASGISLTKSAELATEMRSIIRQFPEVKMVMSQSGRNDSGTDPFGPNRNELLIEMHPYNTWTTGRNKAQLVEELSRKLRAEIPGSTFNFTQPIIDTSTEIATGSSADLAVIITGPDLLELRRLATQALGVVRTIPGAADMSIEQEADQPQLRIPIKRQEAARYGIKMSDIEDTIELAIGGRAIGTVFEGERRFDIAARFIPEARSDATAIGNILVPAPDGSRIPLSQLADIDVKNGATIIARRENKRSITVRTNIRERDQGGFVNQAQSRFAREVKLPDGYQVVWGGQFENLQRARARLSVIIPVTILIIFGLLFTAFGSVRDAGIALLNVPFSFVGGVIALYLRGINFSVSAAVGFVTLFGVAVMSGLLYIAEIKRRRAEHGVPLDQAVVEGAKAQVRPRFLLILVALLGMIPAATATGIGSDIQRPLATVIVGGLLSTLLLTLLVLPSLYYVAASRTGPSPPSAE
jgi:cobalt-zinc-cadmium resistance protein CzcA